MGYMGHTLAGSHLQDGGLVLVWQTLDADVAHEAGADGQEAYQGQEHLVQYSTVQHSTVQGEEHLAPVLEVPPRLLGVRGGEDDEHQHGDQEADAAGRHAAGGVGPVSPGQGRAQVMSLGHAPVLLLGLLLH